MMASISILTDDAVLYILEHLDIQDRIAIPYTCQRFRRICMDGRVFRKVDLSGRPVLRKLRGTIKEFFRDEQMAQHIRELNFSNHRVSNWQMDDDFEDFIILNCLHLEALHVLNCGMSFQRLNRILQQTPKLTCLSWSLRDLTSEETKFLLKGIKSSDEIGLKNIKHLHLEMNGSISHIRVMKNLVLSCCKNIEELQIYIWHTDEVYCNELMFPFPKDQITPAFPEPSTTIEDMLEHLHSLTVVAVGGPSRPCSVAHYNHVYKEELCDFIFSIVKKKSHKTKWKKLWISPPIGISRLQDMFHLADSSVPLLEDHPHDIHSVEAITAHAGESHDAVDELKTFFQRIEDNSVRSLHLCQPTSRSNSILELCEPILRVGGHALKFLSLSFNPLHGIDAEQNIVLHTLFSNCLNVSELNLLGCYFEKDICEPLSKLKHLTKVQLMQCAISPKKCNENQAEISKTNFTTFLENCKNIIDFEVHGCGHNHSQLSCHLKDDDLLALSKLRNLESLTLIEISGISEWTFLQNISENCKFLTMLRILAKEHFNKSHIPILMDSAKFLKHLALNVSEVDLGSESFWKLLSCATNLKRLCIKSYYEESLNVPIAVETLRCLPQLQVLHLHSCHLENVEVFHDEMIRMLKEEKSDRSFFFELVMDCFGFMSQKNCTSNKALPLNEVELCHMTPLLAIPMF